MTKVKGLNSLIIAVFPIISGLLFLGADNAEAGTGGCIVGIEKTAIPADDTLFTFQVTGDGIEEFHLQDPSDDIEEIVIPVESSLTLTELVPEGWTLEDISCEDGIQNCGNEVFEPCFRTVISGDTVTLICEDNDFGSCEFTNVQNVSFADVPALSEWGLMAMAAVLGLIGFLAVRRKTARAS